MGGRWKAYRRYNASTRLERKSRGKTYTRYVEDESSFMNGASKNMKSGWTTADTKEGNRLKNVYVGRGTSLATYNGVVRGRK